MNIALWIVQIILVIMFSMAGSMKLMNSREELVKKGLKFAKDFSPGTLKFIGFSEILGAVGLIVPQATNTAPFLTPLAAVGLGLIMIGAIATHARRKESKTITITFILLVLATFVAIGRFIELAA